MIERCIRLLCSLFILCILMLAREAPLSVCGTDRERGSEEHYLHGRAEAKRGLTRSARLKALTASAATTNRDYGYVAVIDDSEGAVAQRNDFNLNQKTVAFVPSNTAITSYRVQVSGTSYDTAAALAGANLVGLGDDDTQQVYLPFEFPFFGARYRNVWVNSDGNLTFGEGDDNSTDRSLGRLTGGAPRIAPLFSDLDPTSARGTGGVRVLAEQGRAVISWHAVPAYSDFGIGALQTFQVRLYPDGRIEMAFDTVSVSQAVTGIGPGRLRGALSLVSLVSAPRNEFTGPVADRFTSSPSVDIATVAQKFYATHEDAYDYLVIYNSLGVDAAPGAVAFEVTVRNPATGLGTPPVDKGADYGSPRRLQAVLNMGPLYQYPDDLNAQVSGRKPSGDTTLSVLAHETGHLFLAFASVSDPADPAAQPMLGRALVHWSFNFNSEASFLEGTRLEDQGEGKSPRFRTVATVQQYSPLDQYLMGFRAPEDVPPTFLVTGSPYPASRVPQVGIQFDGVRRNITVDDVAAVVGRRTPDSTVAQRRFRFAFILVSQAGQAAQPSQVAKVEAIRGAFERFYAAGTSDRASADTALRRAVQLSASPAAGILVNGTGTASLSLEAPAESALTFTLTSSGGAVQAPASVTVPAGATRATFPIQGIREGVADLVATPPDGSFETAYARVQVRAVAAGLSLKLLSSEHPATTAEPVRVRVVDLNQTPYSGVRVSAAVTTGTLDSATVTTDENGVAVFHWTPAASAGKLRAAIDVVPDASVIVTLSGSPAITPAAIVNAASFVPGITPGSFATIFGTGLSAGVTASLTPPLPYGVRDTQVLVNGSAVQLSYVGESQINFVAPWSITGSTATVEIDNSAGKFSGFTVAVSPVSPGIFPGAVLIAGTGLTTQVLPAKSGDTLEIYATGLGPVVPSTAYPGLQETATRPQVLIGNVPAESVVSVLSPQFPGLYQINAKVAPGTPSGDQPVVLVMGAVRSNPVQIRVE